MSDWTGSEKDLVAAIRQDLGSLGYAVEVVGQAKAKGSGTTVGYPDLSVRRSGWPRGLTLLLEAKTATGTLRPDQERLHADGWSFVVRSVRGAALSVRVTELALGELDGAQRIERWLARNTEAL